MLTNVINKYDVLSCIGVGAFGTRYKVSKKNSGRKFVWKSIDCSNMNEDHKRILFNDLKLIMDINHPNLTIFNEYTYNQETKTVYTIMEHCEGGDLYTLIVKCKQEVGNLEERFIWRLFYQLSKALQCCQRLKLEFLQRVILPSNIFLDLQGNVKLGDFVVKGITEPIGSKSNKRENLGYKSIEVRQIRNSKNDYDIWSLGCLGYESCYLDPPFFEKNVSQHLNIKKKLCDDEPTFYSNELRKIIWFLLDIREKVSPTVEMILHHPVINSNQSNNTGYPQIIINVNNTNKHSISKQNHYENFVAGLVLENDRKHETNKISCSLPVENSARFQSINFREQLIEQKENYLKAKEKELFLREKKLKVKQRKKEVDESLISIEPNDTIVEPTVAKLDPNKIIKPKILQNKRNLRNQNASPYKLKVYSIENLKIKDKNEFSHNEILKKTTKSKLGTLFRSNKENFQILQSNVENSSTGATTSNLSTSTHEMIKSKWSEESKKNAFEMLAVLSLNENKPEKHVKKLKKMISIRERKDKPLIFYEKHTKL